MDNQSLTSEQQEFAQELGFSVGAEAPNTEGGDGGNPNTTASTDAGSGGASETGEDSIESLLQGNEKQEKGNPLAEIDEDLLHQHRFYKQTGIKNYSTYEKVMGTTQQDSPEQQIELMLTVEEIEGKMPLTSEEREIIKSRKMKLYGLDEDSTEEEKVFGRLQLRKDLNAAQQKIAEIQAAVKGAPIETSSIDPSIKNSVIEAAKEKFSLTIEEEGEKFTFAPEAKDINPYFVEYMKAIEAGQLKVEKDAKAEAAAYAKLRYFMDNHEVAIKVAYKLGKEAAIKAASGKYTETRSPNSNSTHTQSLESVFGL